MSLRSGRLHVSEQRAHLHHVHAESLQRARPHVDSSAPVSLLTRGRLVDGKAILDAHARATLVGQENARLGAKLQSIYCRSAAQGHRTAAQREAHMHDPELDRLRRHTQTCLDMRRAASAERTLHENKYIAARLAAAPASTGSLQAARRYDEVLAERVALRSRFKTDGDYQIYLAGREKRQERLLARRAVRLALKEAEREGGEWGAMQRQLRAQAESRMALLPPSPQRQQQQLQLRSPGAHGSHDRSSAGSSAHGSSRHPFASSASRSVLDHFEEQLCQGPSSRADHSDYDEEEEEERRREEEEAEEEERFEVERASARAGSDQYEEKEQHASAPRSESASAAQSANASTRGASRRSDRHSSGSGKDGPNRSRSRSRSADPASVRRMPSGQLSRPPSRSPNPQWDSRDYILAAAGLHYKPQHATASASPKSSAGASGSMRGSASGKSLAVMHPSRSPSSAGSASLLARSPSASGSALYFGARGSGEAALERDGVMVERALAAAAVAAATAARKRADSASAPKSRSEARSPSQAHRRPTSAAVAGHYARPLPAPSAPVGRTRPVSAAPFNGLHSHDERGSRSATSLAAFLRGGTDHGQDHSRDGAAMPHSMSRSAHSVSAAALLSDPAVERELAAILREQNLDDHTLMERVLHDNGHQHGHGHGQHGHDDHDSAATRDRQCSEDSTGTASSHQSRRRKKMHEQNRLNRGGSVVFTEDERAHSHAAQLARAREEVVAVARGMTSASAGSGRSDRDRAQAATVSSTLEFLDDDQDVDALAASAAPALAQSAAFPVEHQADSDAYSEDEAHSSPAGAGAVAGPEHPESEIAPPARPWPSPPGLPPLAFQAALAKEEALAREDATVPLAPAPADGEDADEEERWRGRLDWEEALAEVPTPRVTVPPSAPAATAVADASAHAFSEKQAPAASEPATAAPVAVAAEAKQQQQQPSPLPPVASSLSRAPSSTKLKPLLVASQSRSRLQQADREPDPLPDEVCYSTNVSVADLKMLMGVPADRGHGGSAGSATKTPGGKHLAHRSSASLTSLTAAHGASQRRLDRQPSGGSLAHSRSQSRLSAAGTASRPASAAAPLMHIAAQQA